MKGFTYILECCDSSYYVGSTIDLVRRTQQHMQGVGAIYTSKRLPVKLAYFEVFNRIDTAFYREHQVKKWRREKKEALINGRHDLLPGLARRYTKKGVPYVVME